MEGEGPAVQRLPAPGSSGHAALLETSQGLFVSLQGRHQRFHQERIQKSWKGGQGLVIPYPVPAAVPGAIPAAGPQAPHGTFWGPSAFGVVLQLAVSSCGSPNPPQGPPRGHTPSPVHSCRDQPSPSCGCRDTASLPKPLRGPSSSPLQRPCPEAPLRQESPGHQINLAEHETSQPHAWVQGSRVGLRPAAPRDQD